MPYHLTGVCLLNRFVKTTTSRLRKGGSCSPPPPIIVVERKNQARNDNKKEKKTITLDSVSGGELPAELSPAYYFKVPFAHSAIFCHNGAVSVVDVLNNIHDYLTVWLRNNNTKQKEWDTLSEIQGATVYRGSFTTFEPDRIIACNAYSVVVEEGASVSH
jgi:hypothetical protein